MAATRRRSCTWKTVVGQKPSSPTQPIFAVAPYEVDIVILAIEPSHDDGVTIVFVGLLDVCHLVAEPLHFCGNGFEVRRRRCSVPRFHASKRVLSDDARDQISSSIGFQLQEWQFQLTNGALARHWIDRAKRIKLLRIA